LLSVTSFFVRRRQAPDGRGYSHLAFEEGGEVGHLFEPKLESDALDWLAGDQPAEAFARTQLIDPVLGRESEQSCKMPPQLAFTHAGFPGQIAGAITGRSDTVFPIPDGIQATHSVEWRNFSVTSMHTGEGGPIFQKIIWPFGNIFHSASSYLPASEELHKKPPAVEGRGEGKEAVRPPDVSKSSFVLKQIHLSTLDFRPRTLDSRP
jgi:hypothetical protein